MLFELRDLCFGYAPNDTFRLDAISLRLETPRIAALVGSNGSGKTTLIRILLRQIVSYAGRYSIDGIETTNITGDLAHYHRIGYSPEQTVLDDELTGFETITIVKEIRGISDEEFGRELALMRNLLNCDDWLEGKKCRDYSQGMRKKVSIMIALLGGLSMAILDEPTNGLDPVAVFGLKKLIQHKKESGCGILVSSHILDFIEKLADDIIVLKRGAIQYSGSLQGLHAQWPQALSLDEIYFALYNSQAAGEQAVGGQP